ncbi:hypothetical protein ACOME3_008170 [Neoechinorhynchus agilis]
MIMEMQLLQDRLSVDEPNELLNMSTRNAKSTATDRIKRTYAELNDRTVKFRLPRIPLLNDNDRMIGMALDILNIEEHRSFELSVASESVEREQRKCDENRNNYGSQDHV